MTPEPDAIARTLAYHERTKHHPQRYARSLGYLDWETQPEPFRTFPGTMRTALPLSADTRRAPADALWRLGGLTPEPVTLETLGLFLELALGVSAWKEAGPARWALRNNPSSGNLHPTEGYLVTAERPGLAAGIHHYVSRDHALELRGAPTAAGRREWAESLGPDVVLLGLSSVHWREAWKYGERAYRYCQHDVGHALGAARFAAAVLGWRVRLVDAVSDAELAALLGLNVGAEGEERAPDPEFPDLLLQISAPAATPRPALAHPEFARLAAGLEILGQAYPSSTASVEWEILDEVAAAAAFPGGVDDVDAPAAADADNAPAPGLSDPGGPTAVALIRRRRSAVSLDGETGMSRGAFLILLARLLPGPGKVPWDLLPWAPRVHPVLFVHRVTDIEPGLYLLERRPGVVTELREAASAELTWDRVVELEGGCGFWRLRMGDFRDAARVISCHQEIAADGAFSLGMLAEFGDTIRDRGAWWYRRLFHEAGLLGQALYLAAESADLQGTGIGCYFDDAMHDILGLTGDRFQSLYHFTVGGAVPDPRIISFPPYAPRGA